MSPGESFRRRQDAGVEGVGGAEGAVAEGASPLVAEAVGGQSQEAVEKAL